MIRVGSGIDVHAFGPGDHVMLGGVRIAHGRGVVAHSDGDVILHALCDALLGAAGLGDIGMHFPDSDPRWRGVASAGFVETVVRMLAEAGWRCINADVSLLAQAPRIGPYRDAIRARIAALLVLEPGAVNVKATTTEALGFVGRAEGLMAQATVLSSAGDSRVLARAGAVAAARRRRRALPGNPAAHARGLHRRGTTRL